MRQNKLLFEELLLPHLDGAYNLARWLVETDQEAQAVVRDSYVQAWAEFGEFRGTDARVWLLTIVRDTAAGLDSGAPSSVIGSLPRTAKTGTSSSVKQIAIRISRNSSIA